MTSSEDLQLRPNPQWEQRPAHIEHRDVASVAVDDSDRVHLFTRFEHQVLVYTPQGEFITSWGKGLFTNAHSIQIGPDNSVYTVDNGDHTVRKFSPQGELLMTLGTSGQPSDTGYVPGAPVDIHLVEGVTHPGPPFNGCTDLVIAQNGDIYVADGYHNCRIHHFNAKGELIRAWGTVGSGPGEFRLPHAICQAADGRLFVADRENDRIQIFSPDGDYLDEWNDFYRPCGLALAPDGTMFVAELWRPLGNRSFVRDTRGTDLPSRMTVLDGNGQVVTRWGDSADHKASPGNFIAPHSVAVDSRGDVYVGEVTYTFGIKANGLDPAVVGDHQIQKFERALTAEAR
jgi:hypothetical protein